LSDETLEKDLDEYIDEAGGDVLEALEQLCEDLGFDAEIVYDEALEKDVLKITVER